MNKKSILILTGIILGIVIVVSFFNTTSDNSEIITTKVKRGNFEIKIFSSGQLESEKSETIEIPDKMKDRSLRVYELTITDLIEEGTLVDSGDYVATLDHKTVEEQIKNVQDDIDKTFTEFEDAKIDSNLTLSNQRDQIINASLDMVEKKIEMEQSIYESPAIQKKNKMDYDKAQRKYEQEKKSLELKTKQQANNVNRKFINYRQLKERLEGLKELYNSLVIYAPKSGIITYVKFPWGEIVMAGSRVGIWRGDIAKIPDMSNLVSRTFINEIDIANVKVGQIVDIGIDAFPDKKLSGEVLSLANVGQALPNSDAKVFEVKIKIFDKDNDLKPAMTTSNTIYAGEFVDTLYIPSEAVFQNDSLHYVYVLRKKGIEKQIVDLGDENENHVILKEGLEEEEDICLVEPATANKMEFVGLEIYDRIKVAELERQKLVEKEREKLKKNKEKPKMPPGFSGKIPANVIIKK